MKKIVFYFVLVLIVLNSFGLSGQVVLTIDFKTGVIDNNFTPMSFPAIDDSWQVKVPGSSVFQPVRVGAGVSSTWHAYPYKSSQVGWLSPYLDISSGLDNPNAVPGGTYVYKYSFNYASCCADALTYVYSQILAEDDDELVKITLNGHVIWSSPGGSPPSNFFGSVTVSTGWGGGATPAYVSQGYNELLVEVIAGDNEWTGFEFDGRLEVLACTWSDFALKDEDGNEKKSFCLDEEISLNATGTFPGDYSIKLFKQDAAGAYNEELQSGMLPGATKVFSLKDLFEKQYGYTYTTGNYKLEATLNLCCGEVVIAKEFVLECCGNLDASFSLVKKGNLLTGSSGASGSHAWTIHQVSAEGLATGEPWGGETPVFSYEAENPCYLVKHRVENECGVSCSSQRFCNYACEEKRCHVTAPADLYYDSASQELSWTFSPGATSYIIEVTANGCCAAGPGQANTATVTVPASPYPVDFSSLVQGGGLEVPDCYSVRIYAVCSNGTRSMVSDVICVPN